MTVVYIHGVKVRDREHGNRLGRSFERWLAPRLSIPGEPFDYLPVFWGDIAARFRWELDSRPKTVLLKAGGGAGFDGLGSLQDAAPVTPLDQRRVGPAAEGPVLGAGAVDAEPPVPPLSSVSRDQRADFLADLFLAVRPRNGKRDPLVEEPLLAALADAAAAVADRWDAVVQGESTDADRARRLVQAVQSELDGDDLLQQGGYADWMSKAGETLSRASRWPADAISTVFAELRPTLNEFVAYFIGDVFAYLNERGSDPAKPGAIPQRVLEALRRAQHRKNTKGERIVVVTHSMGGQLFYDAAGCFVPADPELRDIRIDHWISCGSQVSLFAELGLFNGQPGAHKPQKLMRPECVQAWTNYYDGNDFVGYIMAPVFDGVQDIEYDTGYGLVSAHSGYLGRPSFFQDIARRI